MTKRLFPALVALCALTACGSAEPAAQFGATLFNDSALSDSTFNTYSCATCHTPNAQAPDSILPGYPLLNAVKRPSFWGKQVERLLDAVNVCFVYFMRATTPLGTDTPNSRTLYEYLASQSSDAPAPALPLTVVSQAADVPRQDAARGAEVFKAACQTCHGQAHSGAGALTPQAPKLPEVTDDYAHHFPGINPAVVVVEKVRHGQFFGVGGNMPLFSLEAMSDADLGALLAFLGL